MLAWNSLVVSRQKSLAAMVKKGEFISVESAFGGFGIYRLGSARFAKYYGSDWCSDVYISANEHVLFNRSIPLKVIQTSLVVMAPEEHVVIKNRGFYSQIIHYLDAIRMDAWYGKISDDVAHYYIQELAAIRDVNVIVTNGIAIYGVNEE